MGHTLKIRGNTVSHSGGSLPEVISPHLQKLIEQTGGVNGPIGKQFVAQPDKEKEKLHESDEDPLIESEHEVAPGMIYKYPGRVLWTISRFCASYCRFCTRGRLVGIPPNKSSTKGEALRQRPFLSENDLRKSFDFLKKHPEINEVILSGGDPLVVPRVYLERVINVLAKLQKKGQLKIVRIGTRAPVSNPSLIHDWHYQIIAKIKNPYLMVHFNHPVEVTSEAVKILDRFRKESNALILSQSVLLKGVNDNVKVLKELFTTLTVNGIRPYYIFQNDPTSWGTHFTVPINKAIKIWQQLRPQLSGIAATARFVIDVPHGYGKVIVPEGSWEVNFDHYVDFSGKKHRLA
jgi:lysine 2,3-aminomutase